MEKYDPIKIKQAILFIVEAWQKSQFTSIYTAYIEEEEGSADENNLLILKNWNLNLLVLKRLKLV